MGDKIIGKNIAIPRDFVLEIKSKTTTVADKSDTSTKNLILTNESYKLKKLENGVRLTFEKAILKNIPQGEIEVYVESKPTVQFEKNLTEEQFAEFWQKLHSVNFLNKNYGSDPGNLNRSVHMSYIRSLSMKIDDAEVINFSYGSDITENAREIFKLIWENLASLIK